MAIYKASRLINFALGEWLMLGARLSATAIHALGLPLVAALPAASGGMAAIGLAFNRLVLQHLLGRPLIALIMVTLGLGALLRGAAALLFAGVPGAIPLPIPAAPLSVAGLAIASDKLAAAALAAVAIAVLTWFFHKSRTGLALRAIADDPLAAAGLGIDVMRHFSIAWAILGVIAVVGGALWSFVAGGGFGVVLVGLKVFPIAVLGGLDSIPGTILAAVLIGVLESLLAGYVDPYLGAGFSSVGPYILLIVVLFVRPHGLCGSVPPERV